MNTEPIVIERTFKATAGRVWQAITETDQLNEWFYRQPDFKAEVGFEFRIGGGGKDKHLCRIMEIEPGKKLVFSFENIGFPGTSTVAYELFDEGEQTRFRLTHYNLDTLQPNTPGYGRTDFNGGWGYFAGKLQEFVERA